MISKNMNVNFKTFTISNFCTTGIRYLEHLLSQTFWLVPSRFEITSVDYIYKPIEILTNFLLQFYQISNRLLFECYYLKKRG